MTKIESYTREQVVEMSPTMAEWVQEKEARYGVLRRMEIAPLENNAMLTCARFGDYFDWQFTSISGTERDIDVTFKPSTMQSFLNLYQRQSSAIDERAAIVAEARDSVFASLKQAVVDRMQAATA